MIYFPETISDIIYQMKMFLLAEMFTKNPICNLVCSFAYTVWCLSSV